MQIRPAQWRTLLELSFRKTEVDIAVALRRRFEDFNNEPVAISIRTLSDGELATFVHDIVELGRAYGFVLRGDLYSLAEAAALFGRENVLIDVVLTNSRLSAHEKVGAIVHICKKGRTPRQTRSP